MGPKTKFFIGLGSYAAVSVFQSVIDRIGDFMGIRLVHAPIRVKSTYRRW